MNTRVMRSGVFCFALLPATLCAACALPVADAQPPPGFVAEVVAHIDGARELAALPSGDLLVGTRGSDVYVVPHPLESPGEPRVFASLDDGAAAGVAYSSQERAIYVGSEHGVWRIPYDGERTARDVKEIGRVRTGPEAPGTDGDVHRTTSVAYAGGRLYVSVGSSCNAKMDGGAKPCAEVDRTRAAVSEMSPDGGALFGRATRIRNAIALAVNPQTDSLWIGGAGQDELPFGHPYEFLDNLSARSGDTDYGWPLCEENRHAYVAGADCSGVVIPLVVIPAYATVISAAFYPLHQAGAHAFPTKYRGGLFVALHGSWHLDSHGCYVQPARVVFVPMNGDKPVKPVDWTNPDTQWSDFFTGFQTGCRERSGRPTGLAVGSDGSLFVADDASGSIYRIRPVR
ncbi:MAG TPA: hypothetical protein VGX91_07845 [Candidatus Cybelea sp.]|nr:hypothetical protein [Candidatus Cybelea sp.]